MPTKTVYEKAKERKRIADDIREQVGNAPCISDVRRYLGVSGDMTTNFLRDIPSFQLCPGGKRLYLAIDIAAKIYTLQMSSGRY